MITLTEFSRSAESARAGRLLYEDLALVAHLSELEQISTIMRQGKQECSKPPAGWAGYHLVSAFRRSLERALHAIWSHVPASAK